MDLEQSVAILMSTNEQLVQDVQRANDQLKTVLSVVKENIELRAMAPSFLNGSLENPTEATVFSPSGRKPSSLLQTTLNERQFRKDLQQTKCKHEHRTSSPTDFKSFIQSSVNIDTGEKAESHCYQLDVRLEVQERMLGEIAYQLDRRILSYVFQGYKRLYGFTILNIPDKIKEVSTHPLTGTVDQNYQLHLTQRFAEIMEQLDQCGYKKALHPPFCEFIINTYGILKEKPKEHSTEAMDYNNPDFLRKLIETTAPRKLQKDMLLLLACLCDMTEKDRKPLLLW